MTLRARGLAPLLCGLSLLLATATAGLSVTIESSAPIINFQIPRFSPEGKQILLLKGAKGWRFSDGHYEIQDMFLHYFGTPKETGPATILKSGLARFHPDKQQAEGEKGVEIHRGDIDMWGDRWTYDNNARKVVIDGHVKVIFPSQVGDLIK